MIVKQCVDTRWQYHNEENTIENCKKAIELDQNNYVAYYEWGYWYKGSDETYRDEKDKLFAKVIDICTKIIGNNPQDIQALLYRAKAKSNIFNYGRRSEAFKDYSKVIEIDPFNIEAYCGRAKCYGILSESIKDYSKIIEIEPNNINALHNRAQIKESYPNDYLGAIEDYTRIIEIAPDNSEAYINRGYAKSNVQDFSALDDCAKALELTSDLGYNLYRPANIKENLHLYQEAIEDYTLLIDADKSCYADRAEVKAKMDDLDGAIQDYLKIFDDDVFFTPVFCMRFASIYCRKKEYDKAVECLDRAAKMMLGISSWGSDFIEQPNNFYISYPPFSEEDKVELLKRKPITHSQNIAYWDKWIEKDPHNAACYYTKKSQYLYYVDRFQEVLVCCDKAIELNPRIAPAYHYKGEALFKLGRSEEAFTCYVRGAELEPDLIKCIDNCEEMRMRVEKEIETRQKPPS